MHLQPGCAQCPRAALGMTRTVMGRAAPRTVKRMLFREITQGVPNGYRLEWLSPTYYAECAVCTDLHSFTAVPSGTARLEL